MRPKIVYLGSVIAVVAIIAGSLVVHNGIVRASSDKDLLLASPAELQQHAMEVFRQYTSGRKTPAWEEGNEWHDQCDVGLLRECDPDLSDKHKNSATFHLFHSLRIPPQITASEGRNFSFSNGQIPKVLQSIYYNKSAYDTIITHHLNDLNELEKRRSGLVENRVTLSDLEIPDFDPKSVIVKTVWETIWPRGSSQIPAPSSSPTLSTELHVDNADAREFLPNSLQLGDVFQWRNTLYVETAHPNTCNFDVIKKIYDLGCFHFHTVTAQDFEAISGNPESFPDLLEKKCLAAQCYMILVGVHIITRETPDWVWMTYRWTNENGKTKVAEKWDFFKGSATINNVDLVANPYLEGPTSGMNTNCLECHRHAVYNPTLGAGFKNTMHSSGVPPAENTSDLHFPSCYFQGALQTHFLWTIAIRPDPLNNSESEDPCFSVRAGNAAQK